MDRITNGVRVFNLDEYRRRTMAKFEDFVEELCAKRPDLSREEVVKRIKLGYSRLFWSSDE